MKKIISLSFASILIGAGFVLMTAHERTVCVKIGDKAEIASNNSTTFTNSVEFNQELLQLRGEVVQFEIIFHHDDVVDVSTSMYVSYVDETITSVYCLLSDGKKPLLEPRLLWYVPERKYVLVTPKIRLSLGRFWLMELMNSREGKIRFGSASNDSGRFDVTTDDTWYLTVAVPTSGVKSGFSIIIKTIYDSIETRQITRQGDLNLFSANYNQFSGRYYALKVHVLGGFTICDVNKEIITRNGTILGMYVGGHRKGSLTVILPNGEEQNFNQKGFIMYSAIGNASGTWGFHVKGWSLYFRMQVVLMYIDINPHVRPTQAK